MAAAAEFLGNHTIDRLGELIGVRIVIEASRFEERPEFAIVRSKKKRPQIVGVFNGCFDLFIRAHSDYIRNTVRHASMIAGYDSYGFHSMIEVIQLNIGLPVLAYYRNSVMKECGAEMRHDPEVD
jgi:hypothetical protein